MSNEELETTSEVTPIEASETVVATENAVESVQPDETITPEEVPEKKVVSQEDFNALYFKQKQTERELEALRNNHVPVTVQAAPTDDKAPVLEDYDYDDDAFQAASIQYQVQEQVNAALANLQQVVAKTAEETASNKRNDDFNAKAEAYAIVNPDYNKAINAAQGLVFPTHIQEVLLNSEVGPQLDYMLISDLQLFQKISAMNPTAAIMELGRMEGTVKSGTTAPRNVSAAPDPIETVDGAARTNSDYRTDDNISMDDYYAAHQAAAKAKQ